MEQKNIEKILITNRGEVARRIIVTAQAMGIKTVAVYTKEDQCSGYVYHSDEAYQLTNNGSQGYLNQEELLAIAKKSSANAIHPGYGFLSENSQFAQAVCEEGIIWIGPHPEAIKLMGDKAEAQKIMLAACVPTIPGMAFDTRVNTSLFAAKDFAMQIGLPVLLKCAHGGGGKGMRLVTNIDRFESEWSLVKTEAHKHFHSGTILVEKQIIKPRHVEVQIAGDGEQYVHILERECSLQRKHQKIIEESPCIFIKDITKQKLYAAAIRAAQAIKYDSIGTVEFLVTPSEEVYFLEMNTRLQVEHSVTEQTTQIDLLKLQIELAQTKRLPFSQHDIVQHGHAIECRIYAECPELNFLPSTGKISHLHIPNHPFLRIDNDLEHGSEVTPYFDPMLLKLTTHGQTRTLCTEYMKTVLSKTDLFGIDTNIRFLYNALSSEAFEAGNIHTQSLQNKDFLTKCLAPPPLSTPYFTEEEIKTLREVIESEEKPASVQITEETNHWTEQRWG